jgi:hypothetical protein
MNLARLAAYRGDAWARRELRLAGQQSCGTGPWPGKSAEAHKLAITFGRPQLVQMLATIIQEHAVARWRLGLQM